MSEGSTNSDFDLVVTKIKKLILINFQPNWLNKKNNDDDFDIQTKLANLLIEFNEEKEKNAKLEEKNNFLEKQMNEVKKKGGGYFGSIKSLIKHWVCAKILAFIGDPDANFFVPPGYALGAYNS